MKATDIALIFFALLILYHIPALIRGMGRGIKMVKRKK